MGGFNSAFTNSFGPNNINNPFFDYNSFLNPFLNNPYSFDSSPEENQRRREPNQNFQNENFKNFTAFNPPQKTTKNERKEHPSESLKNQGNEYFKKGFYDKAIECYTKAIENDSSQAIYFMNRALAYKYSNHLKKVVYIVCFFYFLDL